MNREDSFRTRLRPKGQMTLPAEVRELLQVDVGDDLIIHVSKSGKVIIERAITIPAEQAWFWTERWQQMERAAQADIDSGQTSHYANVDEAITALEMLENAGD